MPSISSEMGELDRRDHENKERLRREHRESNEEFAAWLETASESDLRNALEAYQSDEKASEDSSRRYGVQREIDMSMPKEGFWPYDKSASAKGKPGWVTMGEKAKERLTLIRSRLGIQGAETRAET